MQVKYGRYFRIRKSSERFLFVVIWVLFDERIVTLVHSSFLALDIRMVSNIFRPTIYEVMNDFGILSKVIFTVLKKAVSIKMREKYQNKSQFQ